jgi:hypothetical protein
MKRSILFFVISIIVVGAVTIISTLEILRSCDPDSIIPCMPNILVSAKRTAATILDTTCDNSIECHHVIFFYRYSTGTCIKYKTYYNVPLAHDALHRNSGQSLWIDANTVNNEYCLSADTIIFNRRLYSAILFVSMLWWVPLYLFFKKNKKEIYNLDSVKIYSEIKKMLNE